MNGKPIFILSVIAIFLFSCQWDSTVDALLQKADDSMDNDPSVANRILQEIEYPQKLNKKQLADYHFLNARYLSNIYGDLARADSLNDMALNEYLLAGDTALIIRSLNLGGGILLDRGKPKEAISYFEKAILYIKEDQLSALSFFYVRLGQSYLQMKEYEQSIEAYRRSSAINADTDTARILNNWLSLALVCRSAGMYETAISYYDSVLYMAPQHSGFQWMVSGVHYRKSRTYSEMKDYRQALQQAELSLKYKYRRNEVPLYNLAKARIYMRLGEGDSAQYYLRIAAQNTDEYVSNLAYQSQLEYEKENHHFEKAYQTWLKQDESLSGIISNINYEMAKQQFKEEKLKNENNLLKLAKREREIYLLLLGIALLVSFLLFYIFYARNKRKRLLESHLQQEQLLESRAALAENENLLLRKENELSSLRAKASGLRESLFRKMSISQKIPSLDESNEKEENESHRKINLSDYDWVELIHTVNQVYGGFVDRLKAAYPQLTEADVAFCCLVKIRVNMADLSDIYCVSKAGITKKKTRMKQLRFGIADEKTTLDDFLYQFQ
ncbi:MAG: tetratricopeptide repeat protein [Bacteroidales bacterium]|jgi:tetratricopeptide (TPR) repeat protein|nr:tetratricopeptide repeat protein [Bacteroidales bacterium]